MGRIDRRQVQSAISVLVLAAASNAFADPVKCQRTIADAAGKFQKDKSSALQKCEDKITAGKLPPTTVCLSDAKTAEKIQKAATKLQASIAKDCGGKDKTCGTSDDDSLASIGWGGVTTCPNFENGSCNGPINDCDDIAACITCIDEAAVDQAIDLYYGDLDQSQFGTNSQVNKCQQAIGKETTKFLQAKSKALTKCWDERIKGKHNNPCPSPGDNKAAAAIQKAEVKKVQNICKACAGPDKACGNADDLTPDEIGFASSCPDVTVPGGSSCGGAILDLRDVVDCVDCVTEFKVDCTDRLTVPQFATYPPECNPASSTTTSSTTTSSTTTTVVNTCGNGMVDPGEPCDPSSPGGAFSCAPGETCSEICTCLPPTTTTLEPTTTSTTTSSTTTTVVNTCGNGMVDPGEPCDPSSPGGSFTCAPGEVCSEICTCIPQTTTTLEATTTSTTTSSTTTTVVNTCGNGMVDPGEPCDPSSPGGSFTCAPGEVCSEICTCIPTTTTTVGPTTTTTVEPTTTTVEPTTTSVEPTTTTTTSTSTSSTTVVNTCGNGMVDPGEPCDPSSPGGSFTCAPGEVCSEICTCIPTTTTTTIPPTCGNGMVDPGEPCDPSSPGGAFTCAPGEVCSGACTCVAVSTTTTSNAPPTTLEPTTTTTEAPTTSTTEEPTTSSTTTTSTTSSTSTTIYGSPSRAFLSSVGGLLD